MFELPCCCGCAVFLYLLLGWLGPLEAAFGQLRCEAPGRHVCAFWAPGALRLLFPAPGAAQFMAILWPASGLFCCSSCGLSCGHLVATVGPSLGPCCGPSCGPACAGRSGCPISRPSCGQLLAYSVAGLVACPVAILLPHVVHLLGHVVAHLVAQPLLADLVAQFCGHTLAGGRPDLPPESPRQTEKD